MVASTNLSGLYWEKNMPNKTIRYYCAEITRDLFDIIVFCSWGTKGTRTGGVKSYPFETINDANEMMDAITKRRAQRGYTLQGKSR